MQPARGQAPRMLGKQRGLLLHCSPRPTPSFPSTRLSGGPRALTPDSVSRGNHMHKLAGGGKTLQHVQRGVDGGP